MQAKIENAKRHDQHYMRGLQYWNKETAYVRGLQSIGMAESRDRSDAHVKALYNIGQARKANENLVRAYTQSQQVNEGGRSTGFGQTKLALLYAKKGNIDASLTRTLGFNQAQVLEGLRRKRQSQKRSNRDRLGLPPVFGVPVYMPPKDKAGQNWANLQMGLQIASMAMNPIAGTAKVADGPNQSLFSMAFGRQ